MTELEFDRPLTPAEAELQAWVAAQAGGPGFARVHGAIHGVIASSLSTPELGRSPLALLRVQAPQEVHDLAMRAVREVHTLVPEGRDVLDDEAALFTVPRFADHAVFLEWLAGLGAVALANPAVFMEALDMRRVLDQNGKLKRRHRDETESLREMTDEFMFLVTMTPPEFYPEFFQAEVLGAFGDGREYYANDPSWTEEGRREAVLGCLTAVHQGYMMHSWLEEREARDGFTVRREGRKIRPNEPCPCGSGKKFKKCHGAPGAPPLPDMQA